MDGTPPGPVYRDSLSITMTIPNGAGGMVTRVAAPDPGGFFQFDSVPIGNHALQVVYLPGPDTTVGLVSVAPGSRAFGEYVLPADVWKAAGPGGGFI